MFEDYDIKIFSDNYDEGIIEQIDNMLSTGMFDGKKVRIMPDTHIGIGCVIGFTAEVDGKIDPNIVGVDLGCGVNVTKLDKSININFKELDDYIREEIPNGRNIYTKDNKERTDMVTNLINKLNCFDELVNINRIVNSYGTLGGGNHFIEVAEDEDGYKYLVIHSGSRNLGVQIAKYYYNVMVGKDINKLKDKMAKEINDTITKLKSENKENLISKQIDKIRTKYKNSSDKKNYYLTGKNFDKYIEDVGIAQEYAKGNRKAMVDNIINKFDWEIFVTDQFESVHNYIDLDSMVVRKGAISANIDEKVVIPISMAEGSIIGKGKGNPDWNCSAPHGAGRIMSRTQAKANINITDYIKSMENIFTTSVNMDTIDEAPMAYRNLMEIIGAIGETVEVTNVIHPVYNFKSND